MADPDKITERDYDLTLNRLQQAQANRAQASALLQNVAALWLVLGPIVYGIVHLVNR